MRYLIRLCFVAMMALSATVPAAAAPAPNYQGMWAVPNLAEAGWGINLTHQGDLIFASWFTYDSSGKPWWLTMTAQQQTDGSFAGALDVTAGPPFSAVPFDPGRVTHATVGTGRLTFSDANNGTFSYTVNGSAQTKTLARFQFATPVPVCTFSSALAPAQATNYQDMWAVPNLAEAGWGINLTHQGDTIFASWFTYDANGKPLWLTATLAKTGPRTYAGSLDATTGPPFDAVPFDPSRVTHATAGTATVTFTDGANGTFTYTLNGVAQTKALTRFVFRAPGTVCQAASEGVTTAEGIWRGTTNQGQAVTIVILDDGTFYIVFSAQGTTTEAGVLHGSGSSVNGTFNATSVKEYPLSPSQPPFIGGAAAIHGTYVPRNTLQLTIGSSSVTASYDPSYDQSGNLASLAGNYLGSVGHITEQSPATSVMDTRGSLTIGGTQCTYAVSATPRGTVNMFNISVSSSTCYNGPGILFFDSARRKLYALAAFFNGLLGFLDMWYAIGTRQ